MPVEQEALRRRKKPTTCLTCHMFNTGMINTTQPAFSKTEEHGLNLPAVQFACEELFDKRCIATRNRTIMTGRTEEQTLY